MWPGQKKMPPALLSNERCHYEPVSPLELSRIGAAWRGAAAPLRPAPPLLTRRREIPSCPPLAISLKRARNLVNISARPYECCRGCHSRRPPRRATPRSVAPRGCRIFHELAFFGRGAARRRSFAPRRLWRTFPSHFRQNLRIVRSTTLCAADRRL